MIFVILDFLISYLSPYASFLVILNIVFLAKKDFFKFILITIFLDLIITNTYFLYTIILSVLFIVYKKLKITHKSLGNYLISVTFLYLIFTFILALINHKLGFYPTFILKNYFLNLAFYLLFYKIFNSKLKLSK